MNRWSILVVALFIGAAAPARAWCEATCIAPPSASLPSHCPSHEQPQHGGPALSTPDTAVCPAIETARPAPAKLELGIDKTDAPSHLSHPAPQHLSTPAPEYRRAAGVFERRIPLRI